MIKLEAWIDNIDYDKLIENYLPNIKDALSTSDNPALKLLSTNIPLSVAKTIVANLSEDSKDSLVVQILNNNSNAVIPKIEGLAANNNIDFKIRAMKAEKK